MTRHCEGGFRPLADSAERPAGVESTVHLLLRLGGIGAKAQPQGSQRGQAPAGTHQADSPHQDFQDQRQAVTPARPPDLPTQPLDVRWCFLAPYLGPVSRQLSSPDRRTRRPAPPDPRLRRRGDGVPRGPRDSRHGCGQCGRGTYATDRHRAAAAAPATPPAASPGRDPGARVRIMEDRIDSLDVSVTSADHAVTIAPSIATRWRS